jgi:tRNA(His) 5'-end guanylyltransferase
MTDTLRLRQENYEDAYRFTITKRLPIIVRVKLRNYKRLTQRLDKPFSKEFSEVMANTMLYTIQRIQDAIFGYYYYDQVVFVLRNDRGLDYEPWNQNDIQKMASIISSLMTIGFYKSIELFGKNLNIVGEGVFSAKTFALPYLTEVINNLIWHQRGCMKRAISGYSLNELSDKLGYDTAASILQEKSFEDKKELLLQHCGIDFIDDYPATSTLGVATYKIPTMVSNKTRNKWTISNVPDFLEDKDFLHNLLSTGIDVFRAKEFNS